MRVLILAGGGGTRLWPLSRQDFPKQFLSFDPSFSLLQKTVNRFLAVPFVERIAIATNEQYRHLVALQLNKIDPNHTVSIVTEPARKNTAAAIALGVKYFEEQAATPTDSTILVIPSDQRIEPESVFLKFLEEVEYITRNQIVLFGIRPNRAEVGYGYIQIGEKLESPLYSVKRFVEKPDLQHAEEYLLQGDYYWNAGIFAFSPSTFWRETRTHAPELFYNMQGSFSSCLDRFSELPDQSIDYALIEKTKKIALCPLPITWSDIGSWDGIYEALGKDQNLNVKVGNVLEINTKNSLIIGTQRLISTIGLEDMLIIETDNVTFISKKGESQKVKELIQKLLKVQQPSHETLNFTELYCRDTFRVSSHRIDAMNISSYAVIKGIKVLLIVVKGMIELIFDDHSSPQTLSTCQSIQFSEEIRLELKNPLCEEAEILVLEFSSENEPAKPCLSKITSS